VRHVQVAEDAFPLFFTPDEMIGVGDLTGEEKRFGMNLSLYRRTDKMAALYFALLFFPASGV